MQNFIVMISLRCHFLALLLLLSIIVTHTLTKTSRPVKPRKAKNIDCGNAYYASRFEPCKKLRIFNPVETFRAQGYAASLFRKCGRKMIVRLRSKYNFPAYGN